MPDRRLLDALYRKFPLPSYVWQRQGDDFVLVRFNDAAVATTEGRVRGLLGKRLTDVYDEASEVVTDIRRAFAEQTRIEKEIGYRFVSLDRVSTLKTTYFYAEPDTVMVFTEDVTELRTNEQLLSAIVEGITEAVIGVDNRGVITFVNNAACAMFRYSRDELLGQKIEILVPDGVRVRHADHRTGYMESPRTRRMGGNLKLSARRKDGSVFPAEIGLDFVARDGGPTTVVALVSDVTERRAFEAALEEAATTDPLTGLANRRAFQATMEAEQGRASRYGRPFAIILGDIDHFKQINDTHGHDFGDAVLVAVARRLQVSLREQDTIARWGGEEFIVLLPEADLPGAAIVAEKLRAGVEALALEVGVPGGADVAAPDDNGPAVHVTISLGVAEGLDGVDPESVIIAADKRLYRAKEGGRNRVVS